MPYLLKTEPDAYSFQNLQQDGETVWAGISNAASLKNLRELKAGEASKVLDELGRLQTLMQEMTETFRRERETLESQWTRGGDISTEDLRVALQRYRSFFRRLLAR